MSGGKGSRQRPGTGYAQGWDAIFKPKLTGPQLDQLAEECVEKWEADGAAFGEVPARPDYDRRRFGRE